MKTLYRHGLPVATFLLIGFVLTMVQLMVENPMLLAERFMQGAGWIEILVIATYGSFVAYKMQNPENLPRWRLITWSIFSGVFFLQLLSGIFISDTFLMTGKLHLPVPAMILCGPLYRGQISVMTILFLSTVVLSGPAWCSHLCYFGAIDGIFAKRKINRGKLKKKMPYKLIMLISIITITLSLRIFNVRREYSAMAGILFGLIGIGIISIISARKGKMMHCILYCPIGTLVNYLKYINPFRLSIDMKCTLCSSCSRVCRYDALSLADIVAKKPGITCTLCGDCLQVCDTHSIHYRLFRLNAHLSRKIYLFITISIHAIFLALARI